MQWRLCWGYEAGTQQVELGAPIHLPFDELELGDLTFGLAVGPRLGHRCGDGSLIGDDAFAEGREDTAGSIGDPGRQSGWARTIQWKRSTKSRADTDTGTSLSMRATMIASPLVS
jgi:hypothetical protein